MTDKNTKNEIENKELNDLLDSALEDFDKLSVPSVKSDNVTTSTSSDSQKQLDSQKETDKSETSETAEKEWTEEFIKQTIDEMDKNLQNVLQNGGGDLNDLFQKLEQASVNATGGEDNISTDFESAISQALKALSVPTENLQNEADYLAAMLGQTSLDGDGSGILSFVQGMMQQLLSKEMIYPSLKELSNEYPAWLEEHKATLSTSDLQRYTKQLELMQKVCTELEKEKEDDTKEVKQRRLESVMALIQEMEQFGSLPNELAPSLFRSESVNKGILDEISSVLCGNE